MKAILVKNDDFKTIGFTVRNKNNGILFQWRISDTAPSNYRKELNVEDNIESIFELVKLQGKKEEAVNAVSRFFDVATSNNMVVKGVNCSIYDNIAKNIDLKIERIIENLK